MNTFKTAVVVVVLLGILYLANSYLNQGDPPPPPPGVAWEESSPEVELGAATDDLQVGQADDQLVQDALPRQNTLQPPGQIDVAQAPLAKGALSVPKPPAENYGNRNDAALTSATAKLGPADVNESAGAGGGATVDEQAGNAKGSPIDNSKKKSWTKGIRRARPFDAGMKDAKRHLAKKDYRAALYGLSLFHNSPDLSEQERTKLLDMLDQLAGKVIYSREHYWEPYEVRGRSESLQDICKKYQVPWQLLAKINGIRDPDVLVPGSRLKTVQGPFSAFVDLDRREITVFANVYLYAGRFKFETGSDPRPTPGLFTVIEKKPGKAYFMANGRKVPVGFPNNPYGDHWIGLGGRVGFHGSPKYPSREAQSLGFCMRLTPRDAEDLYTILSKDSKVTILKPMATLNARARAMRRR